MLGLWLVTGVLASAAADTWATSVGASSRVPPRLIWSGRPVPRGTSGGVTLRGSLGALAGALTVAVAAVAVGVSPRLLPAAVLIGFAGMVVDSSLGAWVQARFHCAACDRPSEWPVHRCGAATVRRGGVRWLDNDGVNFLATASAALLAFAVWSAG